MWPKAYRDYPVDLPLKKYRIEPGRSFPGAEMNELNGWGTSWDQPKKKTRKKGYLSSWIRSLSRYFLEK